MTQTTLTRSELADALSRDLSITRQKAMDILEHTLETMIKALEEEGELKLSSFATFFVREKSQRIGRNPKTGQEVMITPRKTISFKASHILKNRVSSSK
jgi:integration host factor subunit alpha